MNIAGIYDYLVRARRELWSTLEEAPGEVLSRPLLGGSQFHCIQDLVHHPAAVEDGWIHKDILREEPVRNSVPALQKTENGPVYAAVGLETLLMEATTPLRLAEPSQSPIVRLGKLLFVSREK
jgi:uncharacterized damage-inducible protein DinB